MSDAMHRGMLSYAIYIQCGEKYMPGWIKHLFLYLLLLMIFAACSEDEAPPPQEAPTTPELAVVVFETPDADAPTATPLFTATPAPTLVPTTQPTATPSPAATAGMGVAPAAVTTPVVDIEAYVADRPDNINPLTGLKVDDPALLQRRPLMVRVGNDPVARPQVGLNQADMVYEEITEWWVTRFTAIFLSQDPTTVAPIRSARLINTQLVPQYQGALGNSGGSDGVRWELSQTDLVDMDEFFVPQPYFYRENEGWQTRLAFDATVARDYLKDESLELSSGLRGFVFSDRIDETILPSGVMTDATEVIIPFPQQTSEATWRYDPATGKYQRFTVGEPHVDSNGEPITASNVIIYFADHQATDIVEDSNGATSIRIIINGRGAAWLLRDGKIVKGNWETDGTQTPAFVFDDGTAMPLKPGNVWVQVVPLEYFITIDGADYSSLPDAMLNQDAPTPEPTSTPINEPSPTLTPIGAIESGTPESQ
jgi:hypothetical protein